MFVEGKLVSALCCFTLSERLIPAARGREQNASLHEVCGRRRTEIECDTTQADIHTHDLSNNLEYRRAGWSSGNVHSARMLHVTIETARRFERAIAGSMPVAGCRVASTVSTF